MSEARELVDVVASMLAARANPEKATPMAAYMKTEMPFYGVQKAGRVEVLREVVRRFELATPSAYRAAVLGLWRRPHREEKYIALAVARRYRDHITIEHLPLYEKLIRQGAWWDFVDEVAANLVGTLWLEHRAEVALLMDDWIDDDDMWIRRTAIIGQNKHRAATDHRRLFRYCKLRAAETEFFIRKAIGWALREYSYAEPDRVTAFLEANRDRLSGLSYREGAKVLRRRGLLP